MKFSSVMIISSLAAFAASAPTFTSPGATGPDPSKVYISKIITGGTGCPAGTVTSTISDDGQTFTLIFDDYVASYGPDVPITESRKNCQLNADIHYPGGWQYSVFSSTYRGYASLEQGQSGTQKSTYYFTGSSSQASTQTNFNGPIHQDYSFTDLVDQTSLVWSPCGAEGLLNINSQVRITGDAKKNALLTTDSIDGKFTQIVAVQWRKC